MDLDTEYVTLRTKCDTALGVIAASIAASCKKDGHTMKRYLLYFLCFFLCVALTPTVYSLMPESLKPGDKEVIADYSDDASSVPAADMVRLLDAATGEISVIPLEDYVAGVLFTEIPSNTPPELLKTMAVVIRTYAVYHIAHGDKRHNGADLCIDPAHCRGFTKDVSDEKILAAVSGTEGMVIRRNGQVIDPITHISSSVRTESAEYVFGIAVPYLVSVETPDESKMTGFYGTKEFSKHEFASILTANGYNADETLKLINWVSYISYTAGGRVKKAFICGNEITGTELMTMFSLQSANITVNTGENGFVFTTEGIGHGVGLSIYGAWVMAESGETYDDIIVHYFKGVYISHN